MTKEEFMDFSTRIRREVADSCAKSVQEGNLGMKHDIETLKVDLEQVSKLTTAAPSTPLLAEIKQEVKRDVDDCLRSQNADAEAKISSIIASLQAEVQDSCTRVSKQSQSSSIRVEEIATSLECLRGQGHT